MIDPAESWMVHSNPNGSANRILNLDGVGQDKAQDSLFQGVVIANIGRVRPSGSGHGVGPFPNLDENLGIVISKHQFLPIGEKAKDTLGRSRAPSGGIREKEVEEAEGGAEVGGVGEGEVIGGEDGGGEGIGMRAYRGAVVEEIRVRN